MYEKYNRRREEMSEPEAVRHCNARLLASLLEDRGYVAESAGASVAFSDEALEAPIARAELSARPGIAFVYFGGELAGTQSYASMVDLADILSDRYLEPYL